VVIRRKKRKGSNKQMKKAWEMAKAGVKYLSEQDEEELQYEHDEGKYDGQT
jgi:hypothetical protein